MTRQSLTKTVPHMTKRQHAMLTEMGVLVWPPVDEEEITAQTTQQTTAHNPPKKPIQAQLKPVAKMDGTPQRNTPARQSITIEDPKNCPECATALANLRNVQNIVRLSNDPEHPRWLFVLDAIDKDTPNHVPSSRDRAQLLLNNMAAALRLQDVQFHQCHACNCFRTQRQHNRLESSQVCSEWLLHEVMRIQPHVIVALGRQAAFSVLGSAAPLGSLRNTTHHITIAQPKVNRYPDWVQHIPVLVSYPLNYLLRTPAAKARAWQDVCLAHSVVHALNR